MSLWPGLTAPPGPLADFEMGREGEVRAEGGERRVGEMGKREGKFP